LEVLPLFSSGRVRLLDDRRLIMQFAGLERRAFASGKEKVDHGSGGHDDCCNAASGALVMASGKSGLSAEGIHAALNNPALRQVNRDPHRGERFVYERTR
jgi:hypothetical protein